MIFGRKKNWEDQYDEDYVAKADRREQLSGSRIWIHVCGFFVAVAIIVGLAGLLLGQHMLAQTLTGLVSPLGMVWLLLLFLGYLSLFFKQAWTAAIAIVCWLILTVFGNGFISNQLVYQLEKNHLATEINEVDELDVVFVLGGGTKTNLSGNAQVGVSGDRIVTAARLFHAGKVKMIVCTGQQLFRTTKDDLDPHREAYVILRALNVPDSAIAMIKGYNTTEEIKLAAEFLKQQQMSDAKIGIVTSAYHLSRAGRLASNNNLDPVLIPSDFRSGYFTTSPDLLIPNSVALANSSRFIKEILAFIVGR